MNKFKKVLLGALSVLTLGLFVVTGVKVNAATVTETHYIALDGTTKDNYEESFTVSSKGYVTSGFNGDNSSATVQYTSIKNDGTSITLSKAAKLNNGGFVSWSTKGDWTGYAIYGVRTSGGQGVINLNGGSALQAYEYTVTPTNNATRTVTKGNAVATANIASGVAYLVEISGTQGTQTIARSDKECYLIEVCYTQTYNSDVEYHTVTFKDGEIVLSENDTVADGTTVTSFTPKKLYSTFVNWLDEDDNVFNFETPITSDIILHASWDDATITNSDPCYLDLNYIAKAYEQAGTSYITSGNTDLDNTIYSLGANVNFVANAATVGTLGTSIAAIHTGGTTNGGNNSIYINAPFAGVLTVYLKSGSSSEVSCGIYNASTHEADESTVAVCPTGIEARTYDLSAGLYEFGCTGAIYVYYMSFEIENAYVYTNYSTILKSGSVNSIYTITSGKYGTGSKEYNGVTYTDALKMETDTNLSFTAPASGFITLVTDKTSKNIKVNGTAHSTNADGLYTFAVVSGTEYVITKGDSMNLFYMDYKIIDLFQEDGSKTISGVKTIFKRYVAVLEGFTVADIDSKSIVVNVYNDLACEDLYKTVNGTPNIYNSLKSSGDLYVSTIDSKNYMFRERNTTLYAMYNVGVANANKKTLVGKYIQAELTINGITVKSTVRQITWED